MSDSPAVIPFNSDGYELPVLEGDVVSDTPAILSAGSDGYNYHVLAVDPFGKTLTKEQHQLVPFEYDFISMTYGSGSEKNLVKTMVYKQGGASGSVVAVVTYEYDSNRNIISMTRS